MVVGGDGGGACPLGYVIAPLSVAMAYHALRCGKQGTNSISRVAGGGSCDGAGYGCGCRDVDTRSLGETLCTTLPSVSGWMRPPRAGGVKGMQALGVCVVCARKRRTWVGWPFEHPRPTECWGPWTCCNNNLKQHFLYSLFYIFFIYYNNTVVVIIDVPYHNSISVVLCIYSMVSIVPELLLYIAHT